MSDLIDRQAAIDAIWDGTNYDIYTREVKEILEELPFTQPEIIHCKECRYCINSDEYEHWCNGFGCPARLVLSDDFCSKGVRR